MRPRSRLASAIVALMAAILVAAPVAASSPWTTSKQSGTSAFAYNEACSDNADGTVTCEGQSVNVFEGTIRESGEPGAWTHDGLLGADRVVRPCHNDATTGSLSQAAAAPGGSMREDRDTP